MRRAFKAGRGRGKTGASDPTTDPLRSRETSESRIHPRAPVDEVRRRDSGFPHEGGGREPRDEEEEEERRGQRRLMVMVASQCLSGRRRSRYIFTSSWSTYALGRFFLAVSRYFERGSRSIVSSLRLEAFTFRRGIGGLVDRPRTGSSIE